MKTARDVMDPSPPTVSPEAKVAEIARMLLDEHLDGVCVVRDGHLEGVVTTMDLMYKEKRLHLPTFFYFLDAVVPLENPLRTLREIEKIASDTVADLMTRQPRTVTPDTRLDEVASLMIERHVTIVPVVEGGRLVGIVTKPAMLREAFQLR